MEDPKLREDVPYSGLGLMKQGQLCGNVFGHSGDELIERGPAGGIMQSLSIWILLGLSDRAYLPPGQGPFEVGILLPMMRQRRSENLVKDSSKTERWGQKKLVRSGLMACFSGQVF